MLLDLEAVGLGAKPPPAVLRKLGISTKGDWGDFNAMFEKFWGKKSPKPRTGKPKNKQDLKEAKLRYIQQTPWASQVKRDVSGVRGEEERLLTVLYYDLISKRKRKRNGQGDDESD